jgi:hypothetical protein
MRKADIAEWILSLTTTPERAAATAGDLMEGASARGTLWFWSSLMRTAGGLVWSNVSESPMRLTGLAILSVVFSVIYTTAVLLGIMAGQVLIVDTVSRGLLRLGTQDLLVTPDTLVPSNALMTLDAAVAAMVASLMLGNWLARWAPSRELAVSLVAWVGVTVANLLAFLLWGSEITLLGPTGYVAIDLALMAACILFTFAGIERTRRLLAKITSSR